MNVGKGVAILRAIRGMTQTELAKKSRVHTTTISYIESGRSHPRMKTLKAISKAMNVPVYKIFQLASSTEELLGIKRI